MTNEQLVSLIKNGINVSDNMLKLWKQNEGLIGKIACRYQRHEDIEDLKQQGYIGLCDAVEGYNLKEGVPFANYAAFWIRQSILLYLENNGNVVRIPVYRQQEQRKYKRFIHDFKMQTGRKPEDHEICYYMGINESALCDLRKSISMKQVGSLDCYTSEDGDITVGDLVADDTDVEGAALDKVEQEELGNILWPMVDGLPEEEGRVVNLLYREEKTLTAAGEALGVSATKARDIREKALRTLRRSGKTRVLKSFLPEVFESMAYRHNGLNEFSQTWTSSTELTALKMC